MSSPESESEPEKDLVTEGQHDFLLLLEDDCDELQLCLKSLEATISRYELEARLVHQRAEILPRESLDLFHHFMESQGIFPDSKGPETITYKP